MNAMHKLIVKNFGPLNDVEIQEDKFTFLLGEQASGKSTLAKLIYFFRTMRDEYVDLAYSLNYKYDWQSFFEAYLKSLKSTFRNMFTDVKTLGIFEVTYYFSQGRFIKITPYTNNEYLHIFLSASLNDELRVVYNEFYYELASASLKKTNNGFFDRLTSVFTNDSFYIYFPAGRAFLSNQVIKRLVLAEKAKRMNESSINSSILDIPIINYITEIDRIREWFQKPASNIEANDSLIFFQKLSKKILKGSFFTDLFGGDYINLNDYTRVPISFASSGQQEVVWILNLLIAYAAENRKCFLIIEEPEAHLHPEAQYLLCQAIAAFCNQTGSQILITTHSPYILSSFNNLIYAGKCGEQLQATEKVNEVNEIISKESWIKPSEFSAFIFEQGKIRSIKNERLAMIDMAELDAVASEQDSEYEQMLALRSSEVK
jgi:ABC-type cobalamin/Fe3+-siderophores transport system ATPase subunit